MKPVSGLQPQSAVFNVSSVGFMETRPRSQDAQATQIRFFSPGDRRR
jgi:hypothetical protein